MANDNVHRHNCPYCKTTYTCAENCFSTRVTNLICADCRAKWQKELSEIREQGTNWHQEIHW